MAKRARSLVKTMQQIQPGNERSPVDRQIVEVDPQTDPRWLSLITDHPNGLIYHHPAWLKALELEYGHKPLGLACEDSHGSLRGVLPLLYTRGLPFNTGGQLTGRRLSSLPRTPVAGPLAFERESTALLVNAAVDRARAELGVRLELKAELAELDGAVSGLVGMPWRMTYVLALPTDAEEIRFGNSRNHTRIRWAVNKAARLGVQVRPAESEGELRAWYELYLDTMRWHAVPPRPYRFFKALWDFLRPHGLMSLLLAERQGVSGRRLLAGSIFLMFGQTVFYAFSGREQEALRLRANDAIHWRALQAACADGFRRYDFGEVPLGHQGLTQFKSKWGNESRQMYRYYYPALSKEEGAALDSSRVRHLSKAAWRRLPLRATNLLGDWLYGYL
jgi:hypothetical protein